MLVQFFECKNIIFNVRFGSKTGKTTWKALDHLILELEEGLDTTRHTSTLFLGVTKAFDLLSFGMLLETVFLDIILVCVTLGWFKT